MANRRLEKNLLESFRALETQIIHIHEAAQLGGDVEISAEVREKNSGIDEVRLSFVFARTQIGKQAIARVERNA